MSHTTFLSITITQCFMILQSTQSHHKQSHILSDSHIVTLILAQSPVTHNLTLTILLHNYLQSVPVTHTHHLLVSHIVTHDQSVSHRTPHNLTVVVYTMYTTLSVSHTTSQCHTVTISWCNNLTVLKIHIISWCPQNLLGSHTICVTHSHTLFPGITHRHSHHVSQAVTHSQSVLQSVSHMVVTLTCGLSHTPIVIHLHTQSLSDSISECPTITQTHAHTQHNFTPTCAVPQCHTQSRCHR